MRVVDIRIVSVDAPQGSTELAIHRPYSMHATGSLVPLRLDMRWEKVNDDGWNLIRLTISGLKIKKDGTTGLNTATTTFVQDARKWADEAMPEWVQDEMKKWWPSS